MQKSGLRKIFRRPLFFWGGLFGGCFLGWGRKDGFPGADGSTIKSNTDTDNAQTIPIYGSTGNILTEGSTGLRKMNITTSEVLNGNNSQVYAIKNPLAYIYNATIPRDWYTSTGNHNDVLWENKGNKSDFDPCPNGWQVPTDSDLTFGDFSTITFPISGSGTNIANGRVYQAIAWFPAGGTRRAVSGVLGDVGCGGFYWTASVSGTSAQSLYYDSTSDLYYSSYRACGLSVRCVQE